MKEVLGRVSEGGREKRSEVGGSGLSEDVVEHPRRAPTGHLHTSLTAVGLMISSEGHRDEMAAALSSFFD